MARPMVDNMSHMSHASHSPNQPAPPAAGLISTLIELYFLDQTTEDLMK